MQFLTIIDLNWYYLILIGTGGLIVAGLPFVDEFAKKLSRLEWLKSLTFKIPTLILGFVIITVAQCQKDKDSAIAANEQLDSTIHQQQIFFLDQKKASDSAQSDKITDLLDSSYQKSLRATNGTLAKYNIQLIDSFNTIQKIPAINPVAELALAPASIDHPNIFLSNEENKELLNMKFESGGGTSYNINLRLYILEANDDEIKILQIDTLAVNETLLAVRERTHGMELNRAVQQQKRIRAIIIGSFCTDLRCNTRRNFDYSFIYDIPKNRVALGAPLRFDVFRKYVKTYKL